MTKDDRLAYEEFQTHYLELSGRVEDALEDYHLEKQAKEAALKEEQVQKRVLEKVIMVGQRISACEQAILAKTEAKATEEASVKKAAPRDERIEESSLTRTKAVKKGSLETEEGGPMDQVEPSIKEDAFEDRCLCNVDHKVVRYHDFVNLFMERSEESESGFEVGHVMVSVLPFFDHSQ